MNSIVIGIAGGTGSGKSTFTNRLKTEFGDKITVLYHDNYYKNRDGILFEEREKINYDSPDAFETPLLIEHIKELKKGDKVLISEGCTHHRQCNDIGTVKIPKWLKEKLGFEVEYDTTSGTEFPDDLSAYKAVIHCGGCMLNEREITYRIKCAEDQGVPVVNYGILIAYLQGILDRAVAMLC